PMARLVARRILAEVVVAFPIGRRPDRPRLEAAAAVRAHVVEDFVDARGAERALVRADAGFARSRRQRLAAVLAGGSQLEHGPPSGGRGRERGNGSRRCAIGADVTVAATEDAPHRAD